MIDYYFKSLKSENLEKIDSNKSGVWIRITNAKYEDIQKLSELVKIDIDDIIDCIDEFEIPRIEKINNNLLMILRVPKSENSSNFTETFSILVSEENISTISLSEDTFINSSRQHRLGVNTTQKYKMLFYLLLRISEEFTYEIKKVRNLVLQNTAYSVNKNIDEANIVNLTKYEEILSQYLSVLVPMKLVFSTLKYGSHVKIYEQDKDLLEDIILSINQSVEIASTNLKSIRSLRDSYQILFTNKLNKEIRILTYLTIMLTIPTLISSFFGMNVPLPFQNNIMAPVLIFLISALLVVGVFLVLNKIVKR